MTVLGPNSFQIDYLIAVDEFPTFTIAGKNVVREVRPEDMTTLDLMNATEVSGALDFWNHPDEDGYDDQDGDAV